MKARMKKLLGLLLAGTMVISMLAGCGGKDANTTPDDNNTPSNNTEDNTTPDDNTGDDTTDTETPKELSGKIVVSLQTSEAAQAGWEAVEKAYEELHPQVDVVVDLKSDEGYDQWLANVWSNNTTTDVDIVAINLSGGANKDKDVKWSDYLDVESPYSGKAWSEQFSVESQTKDATTGEFSSLNLFTVQVLWFYNQEIFEEVGVQPPTTWDELIAVCDKIQAAGYQPIAIDGDYNSFYAMTMGWLAQIYTDQTTRNMIEVTRAQEGDWCYDPDIDGNFVYDPTDPWNDDSAYVTNNKVRYFKAVKEGVYRTDTPGMKTVWTNFAKVFPKYAGGDAFFGTNTEGAQTLFYQGKAAMFISGGWEAVNHMNNMKQIEETGVVSIGESEAVEGTIFTLGSFPMPSMEGEGILAPARTIEVSNGFLGAVSKDQEHDELVVDFMMYYSSAEGLGVYLDAAIAAGGSIAGPCLVYGVEYPEEIAAAFANVKYIGNCQKGYCAALARGLADLPESTREYYNNAYSYLTGQTTVDEYLAAQQAQYEKYLPTVMANSEVSEKDLENPAAEPTGEN